MGIQVIEWLKPCLKNKGWLQRAGKSSIAYENIQGNFESQQYANLSFRSGGNMKISFKIKKDAAFILPKTVQTLQTQY